jgi:4-diphosphocytidyl-2-C-methyl-D-erythritol kinase
MSFTQTKTLTVIAPAKINLYLHVTGRLDNGYHTLDSLIAFADIADKIELSPAEDFSFEVDGPFSSAFGPKELDASPYSANLVVQAAWAMSRAAQKTLNVRARLTKNLPMGAGIGGGSSDAAALIWALMEWWKLPQNSAPYLPELMASLGADVPVCLPCKTARVRGIGDILDKTPPLPEIPIVLIYPGKPCPTAEIFNYFTGGFKEPQALPESFQDFDDFIGFLKKSDNDLKAPACAIVPDIKNALNALDTQKGCAFAQMTGSGSSCFGLFKDEESALKAVQSIAQDNPDWWVKAGWLARPERY